MEGRFWHPDVVTYERMTVQAETPTNNYQNPDPQPYAFDDLDEWLLQNLGSDDPIIDVRRRDLIGWLTAANCTILDLRYLGEPEQWEVRFTPAVGEYGTAAEAERLLRHVASRCRCGIGQEQIVVVALNGEVAARFRLQPTPQPQTR